MKAALLDADGIFQSIVTVEKEALTTQHLTQITECDLPPGKYKWIADATNPMGGAFWPVKWLERRAQDVIDVQASQTAHQRLIERRAKRKRDRGET